MLGGSRINIRRLVSYIIVMKRYIHHKVQPLSILFADFIVVWCKYLPFLNLIGPPKNTRVTSDQVNHISL